VCCPALSTDQEITPVSQRYKGELELLLTLYAMSAYGVRSVLRVGDEVEALVFRINGKLRRLA